MNDSKAEPEKRIRELCHWDEGRAADALGDVEGPLDDARKHAAALLGWGLLVGDDDVAEFARAVAEATTALLHDLYRLTDGPSDT